MDATSAVGMSNYGGYAEGGMAEVQPTDPQSTRGEAPAMTNMGAHASELQQQLHTLREEQIQYYQYISQWILSATGGIPGDVTADQAVAQQCLVDISSSATCRGYLEQLRQCMECCRLVERSLLEAEDSASPSYTSAIESLGSATYYHEMSLHYMEGATQALPLLSTIASAIEGRLGAVRYDLYRKLIDQVQACLTSLSWPPPLTEAAPQASQTALANGDPNVTQDPAANASSGGGTFQGFTANPSLTSRLLDSLSSLSKMQMACERAQFASLAEQATLAASVLSEGSTGAGKERAGISDSPILWAMAQLTAPLQVLLQAHFSPGTEAGRLDKPQWLFKTITKILKDAIPHVESLQPMLVDSGLHHYFHVCVEFARCMRENTKAVLRGVRLPGLLAAEPEGGPMWLALVDEIVGFEAQLAPYLGAAHVNSQDPDAEVPDTVVSGSTLDAIVAEPDFFRCWIAAELAAADQKVDPLLQQEHMWKLASQRDEGMMVDDGLSEGPLPGWKREFNPPLMAERALDILTAVINRSRHIPKAADQKIFIEQVLSPILDRIIYFLRDAFEDASATDMTSSPRLAACVTAVRYLLHNLSDLFQGSAVYRLLEQHQRDQQNLEGDGVAASQARPAKSRLGQSNASPSWTVGTVIVRHCFTPTSHELPVLPMHFAMLRAMHRDWCLFIAREMARGFGKLAATYRQTVEDAGTYPVNTGPADSVSPALLPALSYLQDGVQFLAPLLDSPSFRDIWRAVSVPANRFMFNYVATEARFTPAGASQFLTDVSGMVSVFSPYTKRPAAHFRELLAACRLLLLEDERAADVVRRMSGVTASQGEMALHKCKDPVLIELGVVFLSPQQIICVVEHRL
eukprot:gene6287-2919_t